MGFVPRLSAPLNSLSDCAPNLETQTDYDMKLNSLTITLQSWGENKGKYIAAIEYEGEHHATKLTLSPEVSGQLLGFCGPVITAAATKAAREIEANIVGSLEEAKRPMELEAGV